MSAPGGGTPDGPDFVRARFTVRSGARQGEEIPVHFNPVSLQYQVQNSMQQQGGGAQQYVSQSTGKLTMDLQFDTTGDGTDVRNATLKVAKLMEPENRIPPTVLFEWGAYKLEGTVESYKETIDFFSPTGVPLRASVNLTLAARTEAVFTGGSDKRFGVSSALSDLDAVEVPTADPGSRAPTGAGSPAEVAVRAGAPGAARALGAANGAESLRFSAGASLTVSGGITLSGPAAFASGGAGFGIGGGAGAGIGIGGGAGIGIGGSAGIGIGASASAGIGFSAGAGVSAGAGASLRVGGGASAGVSASAGAFAGLGAKGSAKLSAGATLDPGRLAGAGGVHASATLSTGSVAVGGRAVAQGSASLGAEVRGTLRGRLSWDGG